MPLIDRIGVDVGGKLPIEDAVEAARQNQLKFIDVQLDIGANRIDLFDDARITRLSDQISRAGIEVGLHTLSAGLSNHIVMRGQTIIRAFDAV